MVRVRALIARSLGLHLALEAGFRRSRFWTQRDIAVATQCSDKNWGLVVRGPSVQQCDGRADYRMPTHPVLVQTYQEFLLPESPLLLEYRLPMTLHELGALALPWNHVGRFGLVVNREKG